MKTLPIQVTEEGVLIPKEYLQQANEFEVVIQNGDILVRPKQSEPLPDVHKRFPWIGIGTSKDPTASERVEEILTAELGRRSDEIQESSPLRELLPSESSRFSFVGIARSKNPNASVNIEDTLQNSSNKPSLSGE
jgi:hypothetical protein